MVAAGPAGDVGLGGRVLQPRRRDQPRAPATLGLSTRSTSWTRTSNAAGSSPPAIAISFATTSPTRSTSSRRCRNGRSTFSTSTRGTCGRSSRARCTSFARQRRSATATCCVTTGSCSSTTRDGLSRGDRHLGLQPVRLPGRGDERLRLPRTRRTTTRSGCRSRTRASASSCSRPSRRIMLAPAELTSAIG